MQSSVWLHGNLRLVGVYWCKNSLVLIFRKRETVQSVPEANYFNELRINLQSDTPTACLASEFSAYISDAK
jgi:hypothetical protein